MLFLTNDKPKAVVMWETWGRWAIAAKAKRAQSCTAAMKFEAVKEPVRDRARFCELVLTKRRFTRVGRDEASRSWLNAPMPPIGGG